MTKADFTEEIARAIVVTKREAESFLEMDLDAMVRALRKGDRIEVRGSGAFSTHIRNARNGRNPRTGIRVQVPQEAGSPPLAEQGKELINNDHFLKRE